MYLFSMVFDYACCTLLICGLVWWRVIYMPFIITNHQFVMLFSYFLCPLFPKHQTFPSLHSLHPCIDQSINQSEQISFGLVIPYQFQNTNKCNQHTNEPTNEPTIQMNQSMNQWINPLTDASVVLTQTVGKYECDSRLYCTFVGKLSSGFLVLIWIVIGIVVCPVWLGFIWVSWLDLRLFVCMWMPVVD